MSQSGLEVVSNPSGIYLSQQNTDSDVLAGLAVAVVMDGSRSFLIEIQVEHQIIPFLCFRISVVKGLQTAF